MTQATRLLVRAARETDLAALSHLAVLAGPGMTNLPADSAALAQRLADSAAAFEDPAAREAGAVLRFMLEADGVVRGTGAIFPRVGVRAPFYSFRIARKTQTSLLAQRTIAHRVLHLVNDFDGESEVGGLMLDPELRGGGAGKLLARARYLFIAENRNWFAARIVAELRGWQDEAGGSPFWDAIGRAFFGVSFEEADRFNSAHGSHFIHDLGPKHPIYVSLLPQAAQAALGRPHDHGRRAYALLLAEGFRDDGYVDVFDGGPTLHAMTDEVLAVRMSRRAAVLTIAPSLKAPMALLSAGAGPEFRATVAPARLEDAGLTIDSDTASLLAVEIGDLVRHVAF